MNPELTWWSRFFSVPVYHKTQMKQNTNFKDDDGCYMKIRFSLRPNEFGER